jgi:chemotaxis protein histidine kinase CheA
MSEHEAEYFEIYLEDTDEQLDALYQALTSWQQAPSGEPYRKESLRLLHAMEGAAGAMGFEHVRALTQYLNRQFDRACPMSERIDSSAMLRLLQGVEFLRACNNRLQAREPLGSSAELLEQLKAAMDHRGPDQRVDS